MAAAGRGLGRPQTAAHRPPQHLAQHSRVSLCPHPPHVLPHPCPCLQVESLEEDFAALLAFLNARKGGEGGPGGPAQVGNANRRGRCQRDIVASRLAAGVVPGAVPNPCNRSLLFEGPHAHCRDGLVAFYDQDVRLLMSKDVFLSDQ